MSTSEQELLAQYQAVNARAASDPEGFWREQAQRLDWFEFPPSILSKDSNGADRWYAGGKLNTAWLALDRHVEAGRGDEIALIYDSPATDTYTKYTFAELTEWVASVAGSLQVLGIEKGDRVVIYMPMVPETAVAMLACARIGAVHSVVFGGFAAPELAIRIDDATPKVILSASCGIEFDKVIEYKPLLDRAIELAAHKVQHSVVLQRAQAHATLHAPRDIDWIEFEALGDAADCVALDACDPLYILYTSGTTGKPKGVLRDNGGHAVALAYSMDVVYGLNEGETYWAASDVGWVVGHSFIVYGPLIAGCSSILFEGKPVRTPDAGTFWRVIQDYQVSAFFVAPTAFRAIKKEDPDGALLKNYDITSLRTLFVAGERLDPPTYYWLDEVLHCPVVDHWWQTETGWPICSNLARMGLLPIKPGSLALPIPGYDLRIFDEDGNELAPGEEGNVVLKAPLPPGALPTVWQDHARYLAAYWERYPGYYLTGDGGYVDEQGYVYIMGRVDDVINVAGHRLSTGQMEEVVAANLAVAECAVVGIKDADKGQVPLGLVVLKDGVNIELAALREELIAAVRSEVGAFANFRQLLRVERLPKTRSGKILRQTIRKLADGDDFAMPSTIDDPTILEEIQTALDSRGA